MVIKRKLRVNKMQTPETEAPVIRGGRVFSPEACIIRQWIDEGLIKDRYKCYLTDELCFCESIGCYWLEGAIDKQTKRVLDSSSGGLAGSGPNPGHDEKLSTNIRKQKRIGE